jgi:FRG domain-containing protein
MSGREVIDSLESFLRIVEALATSPRAGALPTRVFRGQPLDEPLLPRFAREAQQLRLSDVVATERRLIDDFSRLALPYLSSTRPRDSFEWMAVAQHYGVPTRLLDWTGNPMFALWFAVRKPAKSDGAFWVLPATQGHLLPLEVQHDVFDLSRTYLFRPAHITSRIVAQDGWFTVHWYIEKKDKFVPLEKQSRFADELKKYRIPAEAFTALRNGLARLGVSDSVLFPDLASLSKELVTRVFPKQPPPNRPSKR